MTELDLDGATLTVLPRTSRMGGIVHDSGALSNFGNGESGIENGEWEIMRHVCSCIVTSHSPLPTPAQKIVSVIGIRAGGDSAEVGSFAESPLGECVSLSFSISVSKISSAARAAA